MEPAELRNYLGADWHKVESLMTETLTTDIQLLAEVNGAVLRRGGKMLRPAVSLLMARACFGGSVTEDSIRVAAASQIMHNATLLHDDVVDKSQERRGEPTVSSVLGDTPSVLIGDYWLVKAVNMILPLASDHNDLVSMFATTLSNLAEGEMLQLQKAEVGDTSMDDYLRIIYNKTASLFESTCVSAAISVGADEVKRAAAREYGICLGMAFQIRDDILDYTGSGLGKPVGVDLRERKITLPLLGALSKVDDERNRLVRGMVCGIEEHPEYVERITDFVHSEGGILFAEDRLEEFAHKAVEALSPLPDSKDKELLCELAMYNVTRKK